MNLVDIKEHQLNRFLTVKTNRKTFWLRIEMTREHNKKIKDKVTKNETLQRKEGD